MSFFKTHLDKLFNETNVILINKIFESYVLEDLIKHTQGTIFVLIKYIKNRSVIDDVRLSETLSAWETVILKIKSCLLLRRIEYIVTYFVYKPFDSGFDRRSLDTRSEDHDRT